MAGIFPDPTAGGLPVGSPNVLNTYTPPNTFTVSCPLTGLPSDCTARITPEQINAIMSELLALAAALNPAGTWNCSSVQNLANNLAAADVRWMSKNLLP